MARRRLSLLRNHELHHTWREEWSLARRRCMVSLISSRRTPGPVHDFHCCALSNLKKSYEELIRFQIWIRTNKSFVLKVKSLAVVPLLNSLASRNRKMKMVLLCGVVYPPPHPPPPENSNLGRSWHLEVFQFWLAQNTPPPPQNWYWPRTYVETNICIPRGYHLVILRIADYL